MYLSLIAFSALGYEMLDLSKEEDSKIYESISSDMIPVEKKEKVYLDDEKDPADLAVFLFNAEYEDVKTLLAKNLERLGVQEKYEEYSEEYSRYLRDGYDLMEESNLKQEDEKAIESLGINLDRFKSYKIKTDKFNIVEKIKGYSYIEFEIIDGKDIFGNICTLVILIRYDTYKDYLREVHTGITFPIRKTRTMEMLTDSEVKLMEDLKKQMGAKYMKWYIPDFPYYPLLEIKLMKKLKKEVDKFGMNESELDQQ